MGNTGMREAARVLLPIYVSVHLIGLIWYYMRRKLHPIPARIFPLAWGSQLMMLPGTFLCGFWMVIDFHVPCLVYHFWFITNFMIVSSFFLPRVAHLLFRYQITKATTQFKSSQHEYSQSDTAGSTPSLSTATIQQPAPELTRYQQFFWDRRHWMSPNYLRRLCIFGCSSCLPLCVLFWLANRHLTIHTMTMDDACPLFTTTVTLILIATGPIAVLQCSMLLKEVEEGLHIKFEVALAAGICTPLALLTITPANRSHYYEMMFMWQVFFWCQLSLAYYPIYLTYQYVKKQAAPKHNRKATLTDVLGTKQGFNQFRDHLAQEFSVENLYFWRDLRLIRSMIEAQYVKEEGGGSDSPLRTPSTIETKYSYETVGENTGLLNEPNSVEMTPIADSPQKNKKANNPMKLRNLLIALQSEFVSDQAPNSVNISHRLRLDLNDAIDSLLGPSDASSTNTGEIFHITRLPKAFEEAEIEILRVMECDSFMRFHPDSPGTSRAEPEPEPEPEQEALHSPSVDVDGSSTPLT